jgi:hypothetical protein
LRPSIGLLVLLVASYGPDWVDAGLCVAGLYNPDGVLSHSIPAVAALALLGFALYGIRTHDWTAAALIAAVLVSHMLLDWITGNKPTWPGGTMIGLRLYERPVVDFFLEGTLIAVGAVLYGLTLPPRQRPWIDVSIMGGTLLLLQLGIDIAHMIMTSLPKC